ncbi:Phosphoheptose isomerase-like protein [Denitrovibrio acetiphilus DSM 12809]|uniref:Phosphoheptose isomerase n=1 Tax=Denitrovibrio acetiphilus (strain DSM 12809 / NBRC 114555 / N2460) TaxID=522772 RepID=D4H2K0_DENA2|nr:D-sedoheptulose 7-phosphate isomerase [Denitrovibrio acetiphilus]ADD67061.1 Phosphoheptose isomerase-like protein [Denitrovibrio acetiphilus DSM 12809]
MDKYISDIFDEMRETQTRFIAEAAPVLIAISTEIAQCFINGGKLMIFGNGGSAADAQHIAAEFVNRFKMERPPLPAIAFTTDTSILTSIGNDYEFNDVFIKQVSALGNENDVVWGISTSGNSENVVRALREAARGDMKIVGFTGRDGGKMKGLCDLLFQSPSENTARIQEIHIAAAHIICQLVDEIMFGRFAG